MIEMHPQNRPVGYARVSTYGPTFDAQLEQLKALKELAKSYNVGRATISRLRT